MAKDIWAQLDALNKTNAENEKEAAAVKTPPRKKKKKRGEGMLMNAKKKMRSRADYINNAIKRATGK